MKGRIENARGTIDALLVSTISYLTAQSYHSVAQSYLVRLSLLTVAPTTHVSQVET